VEDARRGELTEVAIRLRFCFEVSAEEVIAVCREEVEPLRESDGVADGHDTVVVMVSQSSIAATPSPSALPVEKLAGRAALTPNGDWRRGCYSAFAVLMPDGDDDPFARSKPDM
jgi:hypothetical protein